MCQDELWDWGRVLKTLVKFYGQELSSAALLGKTSAHARAFEDPSGFRCGFDHLGTQITAGIHAVKSKITGITSLCRRWAEL